MHLRNVLATTAVLLVAIPVGYVGAHAARGPQAELTHAQLEEAKNAPAAPTEETFTYGDKEISPSEAATKDLACLEESFETTCYRNETELERAEGLISSRERRSVSTEVRYGKARKPTRRKSARAANHGGNPQSIWENSGYGGWRLDRNSSCHWHGMPGAYNDNASSANMGSHTGIIAANANGGGNTQQWNAYTAVFQLYWNDTASSSYRYGC